MFEYFHYIFEDTLARLFDTCLEIMQLGEVDKFRQPRVWILREVPVVARTIRIHPLTEEFPARIDSDSLKDCKQEDQRDGLDANAGPNHPASPIRKSITNHEAKDAIEQHLDRYRDVEKMSHHEH